MNLFIGLIGLIVILIVAAYAWCFKSLNQIRQQTMGNAYFGLKLAERRAIRDKIESQAVIISQLITPLAILGLKIPMTHFEGTHVPGVCSKNSMQFARDYTPESCDIFVATQMKCGTTWMQQIVHQVITHGKGEFSDDGNRHMYAVSPWIESEGSVHLNDAPLVEGRRIIKTHLATDLCPYSPQAKYIYVARHPAACLASSIDFVNMLAGPMAPQRGNFPGWFCSDDMWWKPWPTHVSGWWQWAKDKDNVLFVHYEELLDSPEQHIRGIADFLGVTLDDDELAEVIRKSGYQYMKEYEHFFEMSPPTPMNAGNKSYFVSGKKERDKDISEADRMRVLSFCHEKLKGSTYPAEQYYPDLA